MKLKESERRVITAAVAWVNVNDRGDVASLHRLTRAQMRLGNAVTGYERALNRIVRKRRK